MNFIQKKTYIFIHISFIQSSHFYRITELVKKILATSRINSIILKICKRLLFFTFPIVFPIDSHSAHTRTRFIYYNLYCIEVEMPFLWIVVLSLRLWRLYSSICRTELVHINGETREIYSFSKPTLFADFSLHYAIS